MAIRLAVDRQGQQRQDLHLVLVNPQIPQNAGSVARTCAATSVALHLVKPLGFEIESRKQVHRLQLYGFSSLDVACPAGYSCLHSACLQIKAGWAGLLAICRCQNT